MQPSPQPHITIHLKPPWAYFSGHLTRDVVQTIEAALTVIEPGRMPTIYLQNQHSRCAIGFVPRILAAVSITHAPGVPVHIVGCPVPTLRPVRTPFRNGRMLRPDQWYATDLAEHFQRGFVHAATGFGKTLVMAAIARDYPDARILVLTAKRDLFQQTTEDHFQPYFHERIGIVSADQWEPARITIAMLPTLQARAGLGAGRRRKRQDDQQAPQQPDWGGEAMQLIRSTDVLLIDEIHEQSGTGAYALAQTCPAPIRIGFTGTPYGRGKELQAMRLEGMTGPPIFRMSTVECAAAGLAAWARVWMIDYWSWKDSVPDEEWPACYEAGIVNNTRRNLAIATIARRSMEAGHPTLVVVQRQDHGPQIQTILARWGIEVPCLDGETALQDRRPVWRGLHGGEVPGAIASMICKAGLDIPNLRTIILASGRKANQELLQILGRGARIKHDGGPQVLDLIDMDDRNSSHLARHTDDRISIWLGEGHQLYRAWPPWALTGATDVPTG